MLIDYLRTTGDSFDTYFTAVDQAYVHLVEEALQKAIPTLDTYFGIQGSVQGVRAVIAPSRAEFDRLVLGMLAVPIEVPSHPARIAQAQKKDMVLLSPAAYSGESVFEFDFENFGRLVVHELVHVFEEMLSPDIESSPGWWSEGLAVYLSDQWKHEDDFRAVVTKAVADQEIPDLDKVLNSPKKFYDWGWTVVRFIEESHGDIAVSDTVRNCSDGDVIGFLGLNVSDFKIKWLKWVSSGDCLKY